MTSLGGPVMHIATIPPLVNMGVVAACSAAPLVWGRPTERLLGALAIIEVISDYVRVIHHVQMPWSHLQFDLVQLGVALACVVGARSYWYVWVAACQLLIAAIDIVYLTRPGIEQWAYASAIWAFKYPQAFALLGGAIAYRQRGARSTPAAPRLAHAL